MAAADGRHLPVFIVDSPSSHMTDNSWTLNTLFVSAGIITTVPLLFLPPRPLICASPRWGFPVSRTDDDVFAGGRFYGETFSSDKLVTFAFIWSALALFILDALYTQRKRRRSDIRSQRDLRGAR